MTSTLQLWTDQNNYSNDLIPFLSFLPYIDDEQDNSGGWTQVL